LYFARLFVPLRPITGIMTLVKAACETFVENNIALVLYSVCPWISQIQQTLYRLIRLTSTR